MNEKNKILKQRTITGLIFGAIVLSLITIGGIYGSVLMLCIVAIVGCYEYIQMVFPGNYPKLILSQITIIVTLVSITFLLSPAYPSFVIIVNVSCVLLLLGIINMNLPFIDHKKSFILVTFAYLGLPLGLFISYLYHVQPFQSSLLLSIICSIWVSDSLAYLVGSRIGKTKLWEKISPKKTWEGFIGGGLCTVILASLISQYLTLYPFLFWILFALIVWIVGTLGDLVESSIKRTFGIKDSGSILPGHGGILDRFDSFIYILPFVLFLLLNFQSS